MYFSELSIGDRFKIPSFEESVSKKLRGVLLVKISGSEAKKGKEIYGIRGSIKVIRVEQNKTPSISESDLAKLSPKAQQQARAQMGKIDEAEARATTPKQKAAVAKRRRSLLARLGTRLRLIASTKKYKVEARNLNKAPIKRIKVRARTETDAIAEAKRKLGKGFDEFRVKNPSRGIYVVSARQKKNPGHQHLPGATAKQRQYEHILESEMKRGVKKPRAKSIAAATVKARAKNKTIIKAKRIEHLDVSKVHNPKRKRNRSDIHKIVRDHIRAGRNQKQILDLMKKAGFRKEYLAEARKIYNQEKSFVRRMRSGKNPSTTDQEKVILRAAQRVNSRFRSGALVSISQVIKAVGYSKAAAKKYIVSLANKGVVALHRHDYPSSLSREERKNMIFSKGNYYIGMALTEDYDKVANPLNPKLRYRNTGAFESVLQHIRDREPHPKEFIVETVGRDLSYGDHTPIQAQRELMKAGMSRRSAGAIVRRAQTWSRLQDQGIGDRGERAKRKRKAKVPKGVKYPRIRRNISGKSIASTARKIGSKALKVAGGVISGAVKGGKAAAKNPQRSIRKGDRVKDVYGKWHEVLGISGNVIKASGGTVHKSKVIDVQKKKRAAKNPDRLKKMVSDLTKAGHSRADIIKMMERAGFTYQQIVHAIGEKKTTKKSRKRNDGASERREQFAGKVTKHIDLYIPGNISGKGLSGLGPMVKICTDAGDFKPTAGHIYYLQDGKEKLYAGSVENRPMANPNQDFGKVHRVEYECAKPHLGYPDKTIWYHDFESPLPRLRSDADGALHFSGGGYSIKREGIVG